MKRIFFPILIVLTLVLTACSSSSAATLSGSANDLPTESQLAVGTLKLKGTDQDISVEQA